MNGRFPLISHTRYLSHTSLNCPSNSCPTPSSYGLKPFELTQDVTSTVASSMCKFPACFCPHPPPTKKSPHQTHDAQNFEHLQEPATRFMKKKWSNLNTVRASIAYIASKNVNKHYQETLASAFFKKNMSSSFTLSYLHSLFKYLWIEGYRKIRVPLEVSRFFYTYLYVSTLQFVWKRTSWKELVFTSMIVGGSQ